MKRFPVCRLHVRSPRPPRLCFHGSREKKQNRALCLLGLQPWPRAARHRLTAAPLAFVIRYLRPKDTPRHLTRLNACKMSNQGSARSFSLLPEPLKRPHISASSPGFWCSLHIKLAKHPTVDITADMEPWKPIPAESLRSLRKIRQEAPQICGLVVCGLADFWFVLRTRSVFAVTARPQRPGTVTRSWETRGKNKNNSHIFLDLNLEGEVQKSAAVSRA